MKKERLTIEDRILIEELLRQNYKLKDIARAIDVHSSTISREIKKEEIQTIPQFYVTKQIDILLFVTIVLKKVPAERKDIFIIIRKLKKIITTNLNIQESE